MHSQFNNKNKLVQINQYATALNLKKKPVYKLPNIQFQRYREFKLLKLFQRSNDTG